MTHEQITEWAKDPDNEFHPKHSAVMSELALIEILKGQMHDHENIESMRRFYNYSGPSYHVLIAELIAKESNEPIILTPGKDPGDEFFVKMKDTIKALTKRKDPNGAQGMVVDEETDRLVCIHDIEILWKIKLCLQSCAFLIDEFNWHLLRSQSVTDSLANLRHKLMELFESSKNLEFQIKGTPLIDVVDGVDWGKFTVKGRTYGDFAVDLCELRGQTREHKDSLN